MAEIINLREFRKRKDRKTKSTKAARNRALSGRSKTEKTRDEDNAEHAKSNLDGKKIGPPSTESEPNGETE